MVSTYRLCLIYIFYLPTFCQKVRLKQPNKIEASFKILLYSHLRAKMEAPRGSLLPPLRFSINFKENKRLLFISRNSCWQFLQVQSQTVILLRNTPFVASQKYKMFPKNTHSTNNFFSENYISRKFHLNFQIFLKNSKIDEIVQNYT